MSKKTLRSMTAYGSATLEHTIGRFTAEVQSVNRKYLETTVFLPKELQRFDVDVKKWVSGLLFRGQISIKVHAQYLESLPINARPNLVMARQLKAAWDEIAADLQLPSEHGFKLEMLANTEGLILYDSNLHDEQTYRNILHNVVNMALEKLLEMKFIEGLALQKDILGYLAKIKELALKITQAPDATKKYRQKLLDRLKEILSGTIVDDERLIREVGIYAERIDIAEELSRLQSHIEQFTALIEYPQESVGKKCDFLLQEMNREINTIGSKSAELKISQLVVDAKGEIEKIREQIQNIE